MTDHDTLNMNTCAQTHRLVPSLNLEFSPKKVTLVLHVPWNVQIRPPWRHQKLLLPIPIFLSLLSTPWICTIKYMENKQSPLRYVVQEKELALCRKHTLVTSLHLWTHRTTHLNHFQPHTWTSAAMYARPWRTDFHDRWQAWADHPKARQALGQRPLGYWIWKCRELQRTRYVFKSPLE